MKQTILTLVMAVLCLNFSYSQTRPKCRKAINPTVNEPYKYGFCGFKSGYKSCYIISYDQFMKGKSITVRNYTITQLFALALRLRNAEDTSVQAGGPDQVIADVRQPDKLKALYCYKLVVPFYLTDNFFVIMQQNLNGEFPQYVVKMERRGKDNVMVIKDRDDEL